MFEALRVEPGAPAGLFARDPSDRLGLGGKDAAARRLTSNLETLRRLQANLWAEGRRSLLVVLQGVDASGKDGTIRRVFSGVNPQGCRVTSFKVPTTPERAHDYLWRVHGACPARGEIGIFNRSHYEDVVTARVGGLIDDARRERRFGHIRAFEQLLSDEGTTLVKLYLHVSNDEQRARLQARLDDPQKRWKIRRDDLEACRRYDDYEQAYETAITATSTHTSPWHVIPADRKWVRDVAVGEILVETLRATGPCRPEVPEGLDGLVID